MSTLTSGWLTAFFLYDVAEAIDLDMVRLIAATKATQMAPRPPAPPYVQYARPPIAIEGSAVDMPTLDGWQVPLKTFDYGVISLALTQQLPSSWEEALTVAVRWHEDGELSASAERVCRTLVARLGPALSHLRNEFLSEDYLVFAITRLADVDTADALLAAHGDRLAQVLRGERESLSAQERRGALRHFADPPTIAGAYRTRPVRGKG